MSATDSDFFQKSGCHVPEWVADMLRIGWPPWFGINGRLAPDYAKYPYREIYEQSLPRKTTVFYLKLLFVFKAR